MNKEQFFGDLRQNLSHLSNDEINEILRDQEEYFRDAVAAGRNEQDVVNSLGDPKAFASNLRAEVKIQKAETTGNLPRKVKHTFNAVIAVLALAPLNILVIFGPFLFILLMLFVGWLLVASAMFAAFAVLGMFLFKLVFVPVGFLIHAATFFFSCGCVGVSIVGGMILYKITEVLMSATVVYLKWNINFAKTRS